MSEALLNLAFLALDHGVSHVGDGISPFTPFAIVEQDTARELRRFFAESFEKGLSLGEDYLRTLQGVDRVALAWDGYLTLDGHRAEAVLVKAQDAGQAHALALAQRYESKPYEPIGNPVLLAGKPPLLNSEL